MKKIINKKINKRLYAIYKYLNRTKKRINYIDVYIYIIYSLLIIS